MSDFFQSLMSTTVLAATVAGIVTLMAPWLAERRKRAANGAIERARQEVTLVGAAERLTQELIERLTQEVVGHQARIRKLEHRDAEVRALIYALLEDLDGLRVTVKQRPTLELVGGELDERLVRMQDRVRRGLRLWEEESA